MNIDLEEKWIDLFKHSYETYLKWHDPEFDGPLPELDEEWQDDDHNIFPLPEPLTPPPTNDVSLDSSLSKTSLSIPSMDPPDFLDSVHSSDADPLDHGSPVGLAAY